MDNRKLCSGLDGEECLRERRPSGHLCRECHRIYMRGYMRKRRGKPVANPVKFFSVKSFEEYEFNQDDRG